MPLLSLMRARIFFRLKEKQDSIATETTETTENRVGQTDMQI